MHINAMGTIGNNPSKTTETKKATPVFDMVKDINSIFLDNAIKTDQGYVFTQSSITAATKKLTKYLKTKS